MFFKNKGLLKTTLSLMVNNTENIPLMNAIYNCYTESYQEKLESISDVDIKELFKVLVDISSAIRYKGLRTPEATRMYVEQSGLNDEYKRLILSMKQRFSDELLDDFKYFFTKMQYVNIMSDSLEKTSLSYDDMEKSGIDKIHKTVDDFIAKTREFSSIVEKVANAVSDEDFFVVDVSGEKKKSMGMDKVEQSVLSSKMNRIKTGIWIDHITGGGFIPEALYVALAIPGGFKSGFMQNVAERMSMNIKRDELRVPDGVTPAIYYLNLEMRSHQMLKRRMSFYGKDLDEIMNEVTETGKSLDDIISQVLRDNGSEIPIIYEQSKENSVTSQDIKQRVENFSKYGYKIVAIFVDYLDLVKYVSTIDDQLEKKLPLVSKAESLRDLALEFSVPVITAAQLNREAENIVTDNAHRLDSEDVVLRLSSAHIAKAHLLKSVPEQMFVCHKFRIDDNDYFSMYIEKDRNGDGKYVPSPLDDANTVSKFKNSGDEKVYVKNNRKSRRNKSKVLYVSKLDGLVITDQYSNTIKTFEANMDDSDVFAEMDIVLDESPSE